MGSFLSSPVRLDTHVLYPVSTYGSGVAPFYTNVALWVGAFMLSVTVKQRVEPTSLPSFTPAQGFMGRGLLFVAAGVLQALVACGSNLLIGVQCEMPVAFMFAGVFASVVYASLAYALTSAFRHMGKALFIVMLIVQIPGSATAPFYTTLGLWVGCVLLTALSRARVSRQRMAALQNPHPWQAYLGRHSIFFLVAPVQALLVCAGVVLFMNIQCTRPWLFLLTGAVCGLVFCNLMYALVSLLGNVGKAAAVVLLVMQIAGSGGISPVQMSAPFFQEVCPFLPFTHAMAAFSDCVAGYEGTTYWVSLGKLTPFTVPSLMLGLFLQTPTARLNRFVARKLEETNVL